MAEITNQEINSIEPAYLFNSNKSFEKSERLSELIRTNAEFENRRAIFRNNDEEFELALMRSPMLPKPAYGVFGLLLGTFPPAAIFYRLFENSNAEAGLVAILILMNVICATVGYGMGKVFGDFMQKAERRSWSYMLLITPFIGMTWAIVTGFTGGLIVFVIGGIFGAICALPFGFAGFSIFAILHRLLERGNRIERKHFLPIAFGITLTMAAFILGS